MHLGARKLCLSIGFAIVALHGADAQQVKITRGLTTPYTLVFPDTVENAPGGGSDVQATLQYPNESFQCELRVASGGASGWTAQDAVSKFDRGAVERTERATFPDFALERHGLTKFRSGPALFYVGRMTSRASGGEALRLVHTEAVDGGRRYSIDCYIGQDIFDDALYLTRFIMANFSTRADGQCCVEPDDTIAAADAK